MFQAPWSNKLDAQLLFASHDASLLKSPRGGRPLEPGQIWLTEKDKRGATELYPLSDFDPGPEEDLEDSYLAGAYGAVPNVDQGQIGRMVLTALAGEADGS